MNARAVLALSSIALCAVGASILFTYPLGLIVAGAMLYLDAVVLHRDEKGTETP